MQAHKESNLLTIGAALEYYDFILYPMLAPFLIAAFFNNQNHPILMYLLFTIGYLLRPVGGLIFGLLGDKFGKKKALLSSMTVMGISTGLIGILPTYQQIGVFAPILFLLLRGLQCLSFGGELPGTLAYLSENLTEKEFKTQILYLFASLTFVNGSCFLIQFTLASTHVESFWRIAFLLGSSMAFLSYHLRKNLSENKSSISKLQAKEILKSLLSKHFSNFLIGFLVTFITACTLITYLWYVNSVQLRTHFSRETILLTLTLGNFFSIPIFIGLKKIFLKAKPLKLFLKCFITYLILIAFKPAHFHTLILYTAIYQIIVVGLSVSYSYFLSLVYPLNIRYTAIAITYNLAFMLASFTPVLLVDITTIHYLIVLSMSILMIVCIWLKSHAMNRLASSSL